MDQRHAEDAKRKEEKNRTEVRVLLSSSAGSEPLCEMASEWTSMPQSLVVAAEVIIPRTWLPNHQTVESEGSKRGVFYTTTDGTL